MDDQTDNAQENGAGIRPAEQLSAPLIDICRSARRNTAGLQRPRLSGDCSRPPLRRVASGRPT